VRSLRVNRTRSQILEYLRVEWRYIWSLPKLKRFMARHDIRRVKDVPLQEIANAIHEERSGPGSLFGYRFMQDALRRRHNLLVNRRTVSGVMNLLDPGRAFNRNNGAPYARQLIYCPGPGYIWSIDGHDSLGTYNIFIHGCVDQYSRKIMWLTAATRNRDQAMVVNLFLSAVEEFGVCPEIAMTDHGTENGEIGLAQILFHYDDATLASVLSHYRRTFSTANVCVESWWRQMKRIGTLYWLREFQSLQQESLWTGHQFDRWALLFVYLPLVQEDLKRIADDHNNHYIRLQRHRIRPPGRPNDLYIIPESVGGRRCGRTVSEDEVDDMRRALDVEDVEFEEPDAVPNALEEMLKNFLDSRNIVVTRSNARSVYVAIRELIYALENHL